MSTTVNKMSKLCDKIERRLHLAPLTLPPEVCKDTWPQVIIDDSISTFSRYFPRKLTIILTADMWKGGWYYFDKDLPDNIEILGVQDINWEELTCSFSSGAEYGVYGYGYLDINGYGGTIGAGDIMQLQTIANYASMYNNGIFLETELPNRVRFKTANNMQVRLDGVPITISIVHAPNLMTISPTMMETFEKLAMSDVATHVYGVLKYFRNTDTVYANTDFDIDTLSNVANSRDDIVSYLEESYVSPANEGQPVIICQ